MKPALCSFFLSAFSVCVIAQTNNKSQSKQIDEFVRQEMKEIGIPGMAVAVVKDGKTIHFGCYGVANVEWDQPVAGNTSFQIASVTKLFTSTLVMKYMQDGRISLDDPVTKFFPTAPAEWKPILVRHLLSHQSGVAWPASIGGFLGMKASTSDKVASKEEIYKDMTDSTLRFQPGTKEAYMNGDPFLLQMILEKIGGKPIPQVFADEIFKPLGMNSSGFDLEQRNFPTQVMKVIPHKTQLFTKGKNGPLIFKSFYNPASYCSGGLYMSINDAVKWATALDKASFIKKETLDQVVTKMPLNGSFTALGWNAENLNGHPSYGHSGGPGLGDILRFPDKKLTIIVFSNYADMYPYFAATIAQFYFPDIKLPAATKTLERGFEGVD